MKMIATLLAAALMASASPANAELWAVGGNGLEGYLYLYDERGAGCPKQHPMKMLVVLPDGKEKRVCYSLTMPLVNIFNPETGKSSPVPISIFTSTPYGDRYVMRLM